MNLEYKRVDAMYRSCDLAALHLKGLKWLTAGGIGGVMSGILNEFARHEELRCNRPLIIEFDSKGDLSLEL